MEFAIGEAQLQRRLELEKQLEKDNEELAHLQESLQKTNGLTEKMRTLEKVAMIVEYLDLPYKEETFITKGPSKDGDLNSYLAVVSKMKEALSYLTATKYKASEMAIIQLKLVLLKAQMHFDVLFRKWLVQCSLPIDSLEYIEADKPPPTIPQEKLDELSNLAAELGTLDMAPGDKGDLREHVKIYAEVRSGYLKKSLAPLASVASSQDYKKVQGYQKGASMFPAYLKCFLRMIKIEKELIGKLIIKPQALACYNLTIKDAADLLVETGDTLVLRGKRIMQKKDSNDIYMLIDISEALTIVVKEYEGIIKASTYYSGEKGLEISEMIGHVKSTSAQFFKEILDELQADNQKAALPSDGTVHEITSVTMNVIKRLLDYQSAVDVILNYARTTTITLPSPNFQILMTDFLENLLTSLDGKAKCFKKVTLGHIFLMNNCYYVHKQAKLNRLDEIVKTDIVARFEANWSKHKDLYRETWKPCFDYLMDTIYVQTGGVKALTKAQKDGVKDRFKNFNSELESMLAIQRTYTIPDPDLKANVMKDLKAILLPLYSRFYERYTHTEFTKSPEKYMKYNKEALEKLLDQFFEGSI
ncbi:Exocyst complex component 7 [Dinochytrium kinnereticum]|nr:Exocyst complex component 7 [Dinochytrium kinnereticum]